MPPTLDDARVVLRRHFGYNDFRDGQSEAIAAAIAGRDALVLMPTGGGKSLCYQIPAQLLPGPTLVVSPLISLMKDQVDALDRVGLPATFVNSALPGDEMLRRMERLDRGDFKLLYIAPERFDSAVFRARVGRLAVSLLAVDEAHCISEWGHEFRPSYRRLGTVRAALRCPTIALTATATPAVRRDIVRQLRLRRPAVVTRGFDRPNLAWHVVAARSDAEKARILLALLRIHIKDGVAIVYASTRKKVDLLADSLTGAGMHAVAYHAGAGAADRRRLQEAFQTDSARVVVATNAFGMGIDKPDVRLVIHYNAPASLEAYYQEAGRAGRDGQPALAVLLYAGRDRVTHEFLIGQAHPPRKVIEAVYRVVQTRAATGELARMCAADLARAVPQARGERQIESALHILEGSGAIRRITRGGGPPRIRLIATTTRIRRELDGAGRRVERALVDALRQRFGDAPLYYGVEVAWQELGRLAGSADEARHRLDTLAAEGFLEWARAPPAGIEIGLQVAPARLAVDWQALKASRRHQETRVRQVQRYAHHGGCRRAFLLRYFGDPDGRRKGCQACDRCLGLEGRLLRGYGPPRTFLHGRGRPRGIG